MVDAALEAYRPRMAMWAKEYPTLVECDEVSEGYPQQLSPSKHGDLPQKITYSLIPHHVMN